MLIVSLLPTTLTLFSIHIMGTLGEKSCIEVQDVEVGLHEEAAMLCNVDWNSTQINLISHTYYHVEWRKVYRSCVQPQSLLTLTYRYINGISILMSNRSIISYQGRMVWNNDGIPILRDVTEEDDGLYYCVVGTNVPLSPDNRCFGRNHFFRIKVQNLPTNVRLSSSNHNDKWTEGPVTLTCSTQGGYPLPSVAIYRYRLLLASGINKVSVVYTLNQSDKGRQFTCYATTTGLKGEKTSDNIIFTEDATSKLLTFTSIPPVDTFIENSYVTLKCDILKSSAQYKLTIYHKSLPVAAAKNSVQYRFQIKKSDHQVVIFCIADPEDPKLNNVIEKMTLSVKDESDLSVRDVIFDDGNSAALLCKVKESKSTANYVKRITRKQTGCGPSPLVIEIHFSNGSIVRNNTNPSYASRLRVTNNDIVIMDDVTAEDEGSYTCALSLLSGNPQVAMMKHFKLQRRAEAKVVRIVSLPNQRFQSVNSFVMLTCLASEGVPSPRVAIYRQDAMLATGQQTVSVVYKLKESDNNGTFSCKSTTEGIKGWKSSNIIVFHVLAKPIVEESLNNGNVGIAGYINLLLTCTGNFARSEVIMSVNRDHVVTAQKSVQRNFRVKQNSRQVALSCDVNDNEKNTPTTTDNEDNPYCQCKGCSSGDALGVGAGLGVLCLVLIAVIVGLIAYLIRLRRINEAYRKKESAEGPYMSLSEPSHVYDQLSSASKINAQRTAYMSAHASPSGAIYADETKTSAVYGN